MSGTRIRKTMKIILDLIEELYIKGNNSIDYVATANYTSREIKAKREFR